jgi:hypothetical protein
MKNLSEKELQEIKRSWKIQDDGIILWKRKPNIKKINDPVGLSTSKSGHQNCFLTVDKKSNRYLTSQIAWFLYFNVWPNKEIDHIDNNPQNNKKNNLRLASRVEQNRNKISGKAGRKNKGVYKRSETSWYAQIWVDKKCVHLGSFKNEQDAVNARILATLEHHGEFANIKSYGVAR